MKKKYFKKLLSNVKNLKPKILVVGDLMLDHYVFGDVERISPEAPVPILNYSCEREVLGGCGNVVSNLVNFGAEVKIASIIGKDLIANSIISLLSEIGISSEFIIQSEQLKTTKKTRFIASGSQILRLDQDSKGFSLNDFNIIEKNIKSLLKKIDCVIISDYDKGVCTKSFIENLIFQANSLKVPIFIDPKGEDWNKYSNAFCITPNIKEVESELNLKLRSDNDFEKAAQIIKEKFNFNSCLITRGQHGMTYLGKEGFFHQKVGKKEVFDVSGAGDTVISCFASFFSAKLDITDCLAASSFTSSKVVSFPGTTPFNSRML